MTTPTVSVVIPTHNRAALVNRAVHSALSQTFGDIEVIVIDDGSTDETESAIGLVKDDRLRYIRTGRQGAAVARNDGIAQARGRFVAFLDSDDTWRPEKLAQQMRVVALGPQNKVVYCQMELGDGRLEPLRGLQPGEAVADYLFVANGSMQTSTLFVHHVLASQVMFRADLARHHDYDFVLRLHEAGAEFLYVPLPLVRYDTGKRHDRISSSVDFAPCIQWLEQQGSLGQSARTGFLLKEVLPKLIVSVHGV